MLQQFFKDYVVRMQYVVLSSKLQIYYAVTVFPPMILPAQNATRCLKTIIQKVIQFQEMVRNLSLYLCLLLRFLQLECSVFI